jgi:hypothetical protein
MALTCVLFAPNARQQNPVEDIWLHAKTWVRKFGKRLSSFALVKWFFNFTIQSQSFDFLKLHKFGIFEPTLMELLSSRILNSLPMFAIAIVQLSLQKLSFRQLFFK